MRRYVRNNLINSLRDDGTLESKIYVNTLKAFRFLPEELGLPAKVSAKSVEETYMQHVAEPLLRYVMGSLFE